MRVFGSPGTSTLGMRAARGATLTLQKEQKSSMDTSRMGAFALGAALIISTVIGRVGPAHAANGALLRYKFTVGQKLGYVITANGTTSLNAGVQQTTTVSQRIPYTQFVKKVYADGSALVEDTFGTTTSTTNGQTTTLPLTGAKVDIRLTPTGKVLSTKTTGITDTQTLLSVSAASTTPLLPKSPVSVGSTWKTAQSVALGQLGQISGSAAYTLTALANNVATIHGTATVPLKLSQSGIKANGKATAVTDTQFDAAKGILVGAKNTVQLKAKLDLGSAASGSQPGGLTLTEKVNISRTP